MKERVVSGFKNGDFEIEDRHNDGREKVQNWRHYLSKTRVKIKKNWHIGSDSASHFKTPQSHGNFQKQGNWVPYELKLRDVERRLFAYEQLLERQRRKGFCIEL